jgi:hypothetical protein
MNYKCSAKNCSVIVNTDNENQLKCGGYCKGSYHGCCVGLPRTMSTATSSLTKFIHEHFICDTCKNVPDIMIKIDDLWTAKFDDLRHNIAEMNNLTLNSIQTNELAFKELSNNVESFSKTLSVLEKNQTFISVTQQRPETDGHSNTNETISAHTASNATQTSADDLIVSWWRVIDAKRIWKQDWTDFDRRLAARQAQEKKQRKMTNKKKKKATSKNVNKPKHVEQTNENYWGILNQYDHADPPVFNRPNCDRVPSGYRPRPPLKNKQTQRSQQQQEPFQTTFRQCHQNLQNIKNTNNNNGNSFNL